MKSLGPGTRQANSVSGRRPWTVHVWSDGWDAIDVFLIRLVDVSVRLILTRGPNEKIAKGRRLFLGFWRAPTEAAAEAVAMDRLRRRNPKSVPSGSSSMKPPRPPRGPSFQAPAVPRPLPEPSSPGIAQLHRWRFLFLSFLALGIFLLPVHDAS